VAGEHVQASKIAKSLRREPLLLCGPLKRQSPSLAASRQAVVQSRWAVGRASRQAVGGELRSCLGRPGHRVVPAAQPGASGWRSIWLWLMWGRPRPAQAGSGQLSLSLSLSLVDEREHAVLDDCAELVPVLAVLEAAGVVIATVAVQQQAQEVDLRCSGAERRGGVAVAVGTGAGCSDGRRKGRGEGGGAERQSACMHASC
jgi:hypothetical protein